jgi:hypothetical protein
MSTYVNLIVLVHAASVVYYYSEGMLSNSSDMLIVRVHTASVTYYYCKSILSKISAYQYM